jgi:hypothetical protein
VTAGSYLLSILELIVFVVALAFAAYRVRRRLFPAWHGAIARLVEGVLAVTLAVLVGEVLGLVGLLKEIPLLACAVALAVAASRIPPPLPGFDGAPPVSLKPLGLPAVTVAALVVALVFVKWSLVTLPILDQGMWGFDTMQYHMPLAAGFAQSGSITGLHYFDPTYLSWFDPANSELIHAEFLAIVGRDFFSPLMNLGWLALTFLAAWCIGRPYGRGAISVLAVGGLLVAPIFLIRQPGQAMSDAPATALLLASAAILIAALNSPERADDRIDHRLIPAVLVAALAAGLALGTKANLIPEVFVLGVGATIIAVPGVKLRVATAWLVAVLLTGGLWYVRNLIVAGSPLPWFGFHLGPLSLPATEQLANAFPASGSYSIVHYLTDGAVWKDYFVPGLKVGLGKVWPLFLALVATGAIGTTFLKNSPIQRVLGATALIGIITYVFSPGTAFGVAGHPTLFPTNLRFVLPALALALAILPTQGAMRHSVVAALAAVLLAVVLAFNLGEGTSLSDPYLGGALVLTAGVLLALGLAAVSSTRFVGPLEVAFFGLAILGVAVALYWPQVQQYQDKRYTDVWQGMNVTSSFRWAKDIANSRIALAGTEGGAFQYAYYGDDSSNRVVYVGDPGPRGSFNPIQTCKEWRAAINAGDFDYIITTPSLNYYTLGLGYSPERSWTAPGSATTEVLRDGPVAIFRVDGQLGPGPCNREGTFSGVAPLLTSN